MADYPKIGSFLSTNLASMISRVYLSIILLVLTVSTSSQAQLPVRLKSEKRSLFAYGPAPHFSDWDSTSYIYSGQRGSMGEIIKFDTAVKYTFDIMLNPVPLKRTIQTFDNNDNILVQTEQDWNNSQWQNNTQKTWIYNGTTMQEMTQSVWNINQWLPSLKLVYHYSSSQLDSMSKFLWSGTTWASGDGTRFHHTNNLLDTITEFDKRFVYEYDVNGALVKWTFQLQIGMSWTSKNQLSYQYNTWGNNDTIFIREWANNTWIDKKRVGMTYDPKDNLITWMSNSWSAFNNGWEPMETHGSPINSTVDTMKSYHYELIPNGIEHIDPTKIMVYPIPAHEFINVRDYNGELHLFNSEGKEVMVGYSRLTVDHLPTGTYYLWMNGSAHTVPIVR